MGTEAVYNSLWNPKMLKSTENSIWKINLVYKTGNTVFLKLFPNHRPYSLVANTKLLDR